MLRRIKIVQVNMGVYINQINYPKQIASQYT